MPAETLDPLGEISVKGSDAFDEIVQDAIAMDTAFLLDMHDVVSGRNPLRFYDLLQSKLKRAVSTLQGETNVGHSGDS